MSIPMGDLSLSDQEGFSRSISESPPNHYIVKIQSFSLLEKNKIDKYVSNEFQAGGYKWKLVLYPNGNKSKGITDHISAYLTLPAEGNSLLPGWEIRAVFRLFLLDQNKDSYLTMQDSSLAEKGGKRFHSLKNEWGIDKFVPHACFNDAANGYLVDDACVFGAEVYVCSENKHSGKGECVSMVKDAVGYKGVWRIENFSALSSKAEVDCLDSQSFTAAGHKWKMQMYPKGKGSGVDSHLSLYLTLAEPASLSPSSRIYADFTIRILDQLKANNYYGTAKYWFSASNTTCGWPRFVSHGYFNMSATGLLAKNVCIVEAEVTVHGVVSDAL